MTLQNQLTSYVKVPKPWDIPSDTHGSDPTTTAILNPKPKLHLKPDTSHP